jgi:hypothetical protein
MNLEQAADVHWYGDRIVGRVQTMSDARQQTFETLRNAVRFVMEDLTDSARSTAFITTDGTGLLQMEEIQQLYQSDEFNDDP